MLVESCCCATQGEQARTVRAVSCVSPEDSSHTQPLKMIACSSLIPCDNFLKLTQRQRPLRKKFNKNIGNECG